jgi:nucleoside 2-deoxyribosyltransferase
MLLYIASNLGFTEAGRYFYYNRMLRLLEEHGHSLLDPWTLLPAKTITRVQSIRAATVRKAAWRRTNTNIARKNQNGIDRCDILVAVLDGTDVDSGTAAEIGYAFARNKRVFGYRSDFRIAADNEGAKTNLQVEYFIRESGGAILSNLEDLVHSLQKVRPLYNTK